MDTVLTPNQLTPGASDATARRQRVKRARTFFVIAVMVTLVSLAGHCLPGDDAASASSGATTQTTSSP